MAGGRPSSYKPEYVAQAAKLAALGATDAEVSAFFDADPSEDDFLAAWLELHKQDRSGVFAHRKRIRSAYKRSALASSPSKRIRNSVSARMWAALQGRSDGRLFSRLGYSAEELKAHLESKFTDGMSWENYGLWHVDHRKPCVLFDLSIAEQFDECWAIDNLQPLWATDNCKKGGRYVQA